MGLSDREDVGEGEVDETGVSERVEETEDGRRDIAIGDEMTFLGVDGL